MSNTKKTAGVWQGAIIWHVNEVGVFFWGSPEARMNGIAREEGHRENARNRKAFREQRHPAVPAPSKGPRPMR